MNICFSKKIAEEIEATRIFFQTIVATWIGEKRKSGMKDEEIEEIIAKCFNEANEGVRRAFSKIISDSLKEGLGFDYFKRISEVGYGFYKEEQRGKR